MWVAATTATHTIGLTACGLPGKEEREMTTLTLWAIFVALMAVKYYLTSKAMK